MFRLALACVVVLGAAPVAGQNRATLLVGVAELAGSRGDPKVVVLHIADRVAVFEQGHIPGARFVRYADFAVDGTDDLGSELPSATAIKQVFESAGVSDDSRVIVYAQSPVIAARAFFTLDVFGHRQVALLDGGWRAWLDADQPVETGAARPAGPGRFTPRLDPARLADASFIQQQIPGKSVALVDVRPDAEYFGTDGGMNGAHAAGHIAGARQLTWNALVGGDGRFLPREELRARLHAAGVVDGRPVVAYCMVGMRASVVYFVARHLGYEAKLYDGSIVDWSRRKLPVERK
jgi:thiosulfate/3-mercaptopyruvate sulfurtransferase